MILQALNEYYQRCDELPKAGFERKEFKYRIVIDRDGNFCNLDCLLVDKKRGTDFMVPRTVKRSSLGAEKKPQLLWDNSEFVLGKLPPSKADSEKDQATALRKRDNFVAQIEALPEELKRTPGIHAVLEFYRKGEYDKVPEHQAWADFQKSNSNLIFQLRDELLPVTAMPSWSHTSRRVPRMRQAERRRRTRVAR